MLGKIELELNEWWSEMAGTKFYDLLIGVRAELNERILLASRS
jgi:hypothetical protein